MGKLRLLWLILLSLACVWAAGCSSSAPLAGSWEYTGGPTARNVCAMLADREHASRILAGLSNGDVFVSSDNGITWKRAGSVRLDARIFRFVQDPEKASTFFATTAQGVFISTDAGMSWSPLTPDASRPNAPSHALAVDPWNTNVLYAGLQNLGMYKSTDAGNSWTHLNLPAGVAGDPTDIFVDPTRPDILYAAVGSLGIIRSANAGSTWTRLTEEFSATAALPIAILADRTGGPTLVYATDAGSIYKSIDTGRAWIPARLSPDGGTILTLGTTEDKPPVFFAGTESGILRSTDAGTTWLSLTHSFPVGRTSVALSRNSNNGIFAFGEGIGVLRSMDGGESWTPADAGLGGADVSMIKGNAKGDTVFASVGSTLLQKEVGPSWTVMSAGLSGGTITSFDVDPSAPSNAFATTPTGGFKTTDGGQHWVPAMQGLRTVPAFVETHPWIRNRVFVSGTGGLYVSTDRGSTWKECKPVGNRFSVRSMTFGPTDAGLIHGLTSNSGALLTVNGGITWQSTKYGISGDDLLAISLNDADLTTCYAWSASGIGFRSLDNGLEWNRYSPPWQQGDTVRVSIDRYQPSSIVALINSRDLYYSPSGGGTWFRLPVEPVHQRVNTLFWNASTSVLYVGTRDNGVFRIRLGGVLPEFLPQEP